MTDTPVLNDLPQPDEPTSSPVDAGPVIHDSVAPPKPDVPISVLGHAHEPPTAPAVPPLPDDTAPKPRGILHPVTLTDRARKLTHRVLQPLGVFLYKRGVHPDHITIAGTLLVFGACIVVALGQLQIGALLLLVALPFDAFDGAVARAMNRKDRFGALLDSALDRYADAAIFAGLGYYFAVQSRLELLVLAFAALMGTYGVSYVRARAEGLGVDVKVGLFSRLERIAIILIMLFVPQVLPVGLVILAIGTNFTSVQRLLYVYRVLKQREG